jgi:hypothetical protein
MQTEASDAPESNTINVTASLTRSYADATAITTTTESALDDAILENHDALHVAIPVAQDVLTPSNEASATLNTTLSLNSEALLAPNAIGSNELAQLVHDDFTLSDVPHSEVQSFPDALNSVVEEQVLHDAVVPQESSTSDEDTTQNEDQLHNGEEVQNGDQNTEITIDEEGCFAKHSCYSIILVY